MTIVQLTAAAVRAGLACGACLALVGGLVSACADDEAAWPAYRQDLVDLLTDGQGRTAAIVTDAGDTLALTNGAARAGLAPDSVYRVQALFVTSAGGAELLSMAQVVSPYPAAFRETEIKRDPLTLNAVWRGGDYLNLTVTLKTGGGTHAFAFVDRGTTAADDGTRTLRLELYHDQLDDPLYYSRQASLSCPLRATGLRPGRDSIEITVNTFGGTVHRRFAR